MPLYLTPQRKWTGKRILQFSAALVALLAAIAVMIAWMLISHRNNNPSPTDTSTDDPTQYAEPLTSIDHCLVILDFAGQPQFVLIQSNAETPSITTMAIPSTLLDEDGNTLSALLQKYGPMRVTSTVSNVLELPLNHYVSWSANGAQSFLKEFHGGITYNLPEEIRYTDENGITVRLNSGEQKLTGTQAAAVLQYSAWRDSTHTFNTAPQLVAAILNQYLLPEQSPDGFFAALSNTAQTDLRIDHFNAFRPTLVHLSQNNSGTLCRTISLIGTENEGIFTPDITAMREQTGLYH